MTLTHLMAQDLTRFKTIREVFVVLKDVYMWLYVVGHVFMKTLEQEHLFMFSSKQKLYA